MKKQLQPYKGVRDFYPQDQFIQNYIEETMEKVCERFGYENYNASILEPTDLYRDKTSDEIVNEQTYTFTDRGKRSVTLRPEMTPTVARMVAAKRRELPFPLRLYSNPNCFRYERPQKGRLREFWQLNVDIFGDETINAEAEIIALTHSLMQEFGADESMFEFRINDRAVLDSIITKLELTEKTPEILRILDSKAKISKEEFKTKLTEVTKEKSTELIEKLDSLASSHTLELLIEKLKKQGITNIVIDTSIVRGFNYYTGIVFEMYDTSGENNRALFGGGRYDNLVSDMFEVDALPTVGTGIGDVTLRDFLETHNLLPTYTPATQVIIATLSPDSEDFADTVATKLRTQDITVAKNYSNKKIRDKIKYTEKLHAPFIITIGEQEVTDKKVTIKNLTTRESAVLDASKISDWIFEQEI